MTRSSDDPDHESLARQIREGQRLKRLTAERRVFRARGDTESAKRLVEEIDSLTDSIESRVATNRIAEMKPKK